MFDIGSAIGGIGSAYLSKKAAEENTKMQIEWERERAKNAHQWEVQDLKAAGLNPILSAGGQGAMTGSISPQMPDYSGIAGISSASSAARMAKTQQKAQEKDAELKDAEIIANKALASLHNTQERNTALQNERLENENAALFPQLEIEKNYRNSTIGRGLTYMNMGLQDAAPVLNLFSLGLGGFVVRHALGKATSALKGANVLKGEQMLQQATQKAPPRGHLIPMNDTNRLRFEHVPTIYRNGYRTR